MSLDFRADQVRVHKIIGSGSHLFPTQNQIIVYDYTAASNGSGGIDTTKFKTTAIGSDIFFYVSGASGVTGTGAKRAVFGGDLVTSGTLISFNSIATAFSGTGNFGGTLVGFTSSMATNLVAIGTPYSNALSSRNKNDSGWLSAFLYGDIGASRNVLALGDVVGSAFNNTAGNEAIMFYTTGTVGSGTTAQARLSAISGSFISGSMEFISGGVRIGRNITDPGSGSLAISGSTLGLGSVLAVYPGTPAGGITASLASSLVAFGMQYQTAFSSRDQADQNWMSAMVYADQGGKYNNLYIGDFLNGAFGGGNPLNRSILFFVSGATATGTTPHVRFDAVTSSFISGTVSFPTAGTVAFSGSVALSGTTTYIGGTVADSTVKSATFTGSFGVTTYFMSSSTGITCSLPTPTHNARLEFVDITGNAATNPHTIVPSGSLTINNASSYSMNRNFGLETVIAVSSSTFVGYIVPQ